MKGCDFIINQFGKTEEKKSKKYYGEPLVQNNVSKTGSTQQIRGVQATVANGKETDLLSHYEPKAFKSSYINDNGKWTQKAVNDGFVDLMTISMILKMTQAIMLALIISH